MFFKHVLFRLLQQLYCLLPRAFLKIELKNTVIQENTPKLDDIMCFLRLCLAPVQNLYSYEEIKIDLYYMEKQVWQRCLDNKPQKK